MKLLALLTVLMAFSAQAEVIEVSAGINFEKCKRQKPSGRICELTPIKSETVKFDLKDEYAFYNKSIEDSETGAQFELIIVASRKADAEKTTFDIFVQNRNHGYQTHNKLRTRDVKGINELMIYGRVAEVNGFEYEPYALFESAY